MKLRISHGLDVLRQLNAEHPWIPGPESIRPKEETLLKKREHLQQQMQIFRSAADSALVQLFGFPSQYEQVNGMMRKTAVEQKATRRLIDCEYPYRVPDGTKHSCMWYYDPRGVNLEQLDDETVTRDIDDHLRLRQNCCEFEFVWYKNPKPTVEDPRVYHVQVFWHVAE